MPVPSSIADLSTTAASNYPAGSENRSTIDDYHRALSALVRREQAKAANVASASTVDIGAIADGSYVHITGVTGISSLGTVSAGVERVLVFDGALVLTHNASSLILPGGSNITTAAGDIAVFRSEGSGNWRCVSYTKASGLPVLTTGLAASGANSDITSLTAVTAISTTGGVDIIGTNTNDSAASGYVGEYVSSSVAQGSAVALSTGVAANVTTITLSAGDWDVSGVISFIPTASTSITYMLGGASTTSATNPTDDDRSQFSTPAMVPGALRLSFAIPTKRVSVTGSTTVYLVANAAFTVSTLGGFGSIRARRIR